MSLRFCLLLLRGFLRTERRWPMEYSSEAGCHSAGSQNGPRIETIYLMPVLPHRLVELALKEVGTREVDGSNCGPRVNQYKAATNLPPEEPWPWCAAFICWLVREAVAQGGEFTFQLPRTAGAWAFEKWSLRQDASTQTKRFPGPDIKTGDIVIFTYSHIGLAIRDVKPGAERITTIEGNTDDGDDIREGGCVAIKTPKISKVKARIRFTV